MNAGLGVIYLIVVRHNISVKTVLFVLFDSLRPINTLSVMVGRVFLG